MGAIMGSVDFYLAGEQTPLVSIKFNGPKEDLKNENVYNKLSEKHDVNKLDFSNCTVDTGVRIEEQKKKKILAGSFQNSSNFKKLTVHELLTDFYGEGFTEFKTSPSPFANPPFFVRIKNIKSDVQ